MRSTKKYPVVIGRAETIDLIGVAEDVPAKVDTGAFRSSIHASGIRVVERDGTDVLACDLLGHPCAPVRRPYETAEFTRLPVRNSSGQVEERFEIGLKVKIGPKVFTTSFSLSNRADNVYPILIGRKALKSRFLIDVSKATVNRLELKQLKGVTSAEDEEDLE